MRAAESAPRGSGRFGLACLVAAVLLGAAIHLDWHLARPPHFRLSLAWREHWLLAVPVFGLLALWVARTWPARRWRASALIFGGGVLIGQVLEPLWERVDEVGAWDLAIPAERWTAFGAFMAAGLLTYAGTMALRARRRAG